MQIHKQRQTDEQAALDNERIRDNVFDGLEEAEQKAFEALSRYKFMMFGYWAAVWVHLNRISGGRWPNPFRSLVNAARIQAEGYPKKH